MLPADRYRLVLGRYQAGRLQSLEVRGYLYYVSVCVCLENSALFYLVDTVYLYIYIYF